MKNVVDYVVNQVMTMGAIELLLTVLILVCLITGLMQLFKLANPKDREMQKELNKEIFNKWVSGLREGDDIRYEEISELLEKDGYQEDLPRMYRLDELLIRSGVKPEDSDLPIEFILALFTAIDVVISVIIMLVTRSFTYGMWAFCGIAFVAFGFVRYKADLNYSRVEKQLIRFISCAARFEASTDDVVTIFANVANYVDDPLKTYLNDFYYESMYLGKREAFNDLENSIQNEHFRGLIHDIRICSETNSSYSDIFDSALAEAEELEKGRIERANIVKNFRISISLVILGCFATLKIFDNIVGGAGVYPLMRQSLTGNLLLSGLALSVLYSLFSLVKTDRK